MTDAQIASLLREHSVSTPRIGYVPSTAGFYLVDVDDKAKTKPKPPPPPHEVDAARFGWSEFFGKPPDAECKSQSGGVHLMYRIDEMPGGKNSTWKFEARIDGEYERLAGGETRYKGGYACMYDIDAVMRAMQSEATAYPDFGRDDLYRAQRAAGLFKVAASGGSRHDYMVSGIFADYLDGAVNGCAGWLRAFEHVAHDGTRDCEQEVRSAWEGAVQKCIDENTMPSEYGKWRRGVKRAAKHDSRFQPDCAFTHEDPEIVSQIVEATRNTLRYLDGQFHYTNGIPIWRPAQDRHIDSALANAGACVQCRRDLVSQVLFAKESVSGPKTADNAWKYETRRWFTHWCDGDVWCVGEGVGRQRVRRAGYSDNLRYHPVAVLPHPDSDEWPVGEPEPVTAIWRECWQLDDATVAWDQRAYSRMLDKSQRYAPCYLGFSGSGKGVWQKLLNGVMPAGAMQTISGQALDMYASSKFLRSMIVVVDDAQRVRMDGWDMMQSKLGEGNSLDRGMHYLEDSRPNESSVLIFGEIDRMRFSNWMFGRNSGWDNRCAYHFGQPLEERYEDPQFESRMTTDANAIHTICWIIDGDNTDTYENVRKTDQMLTARDDVLAAAKCEENGTRGKCECGEWPTVYDLEGNRRSHQSEAEADGIDAGKATVAQYLRELDKIGGKVDVVKVMAHLNNVGVTNKIGGKMTTHTTRTLIDDTMGDPEYYTPNDAVRRELAEAEELPW